MATGAGRPTPERRRRGADLSSASLRPVLESGRLLAGRYRLERPLGRHGLVWLVRDVRGACWALKTGPTALLAHEHAILTRIAHPAVVRPADFRDSEAGQILVLEYLTGGDLVGLAGGAPSCWRDPVLELIAALDCLHAAGLVHRDLKARNVLLDGDDHARLIDFGSTLPIGSAWTDGGTTASAVAPDRGGASVAPADDVYALAALVYELIHGHPPGAGPVAGGRTARSPAQATTGTPPPATGTPAALDALVEACLGGREMAARIGLKGLRTVIESLP